MNAPEKVVFPGHSTGAWSLAVAAFAVGGPFGAVVGGMFLLSSLVSTCVNVHMPTFERNLFALCNNNNKKSSLP